MVRPDEQAPAVTDIARLVNASLLAVPAFTVSVWVAAFVPVALKLPEPFTVISGEPLTTVTGSGAFIATGSNAATQTETVNPGTASQLVFIQQPTDALAGTTITPSVQIKIEDANGNGTGSGSHISISINNNPTSATLSGTLNVVTDAGGVSTFNNLSVDKAGNYTLQASTGNIKQTSDQFSILARSTSTTVTPTSNSVAVGQSSTVSVNVADTAGTTGSSIPAGTVSFTSSDTGANGDTFSSTTCTLSSGACSVTITAHEVGAGSHAITATYIPNDGTHLTSKGNAALTVTQAPTSATLVSSLNPSYFGQQVTFTATLSSSGGTPTGMVDFFDGPALIGSGTLNGVGGNDVATYSTSALSVGTHSSITAQYVSDGNFSGSTSNAVSQVVNTAATTTTVTSSANPSVFGQGVSFTAKVTPQQAGLATPAGAVQFAIDGSNFGVPVALDANGSATSGTISALSVVPHSITVAFTPASGSVYQPSSGILTQTVNQASTTTTILSSPNPSTFGETVTVTVTVAPVSPGTGTPTGSVALAIDGSATPLTLVGGSATLMTSALTAGSHTITAQLQRRY